VFGVGGCRCTCVRLGGEDDLGRHRRPDCWGIVGGVVVLLFAAFDCDKSLVILNCISCSCGDGSGTCLVGLSCDSLAELGPSSGGGALQERGIAFGGGMAALSSTSICIMRGVMAALMAAVISKGSDSSAAGSAGGCYDHGLVGCQLCIPLLPL
jgi:hypothetical protein